MDANFEWCQIGANHYELFDLDKDPNRHHVIASIEVEPGGNCRSTVWFNTGSDIVPVISNEPTKVYAVEFIKETLSKSPIFNS